MKRIATILLAAGGSSRMGCSKQLITVNGVSLVRKVVQTVLSSRCDRLYVVTGAESSAITHALEGVDATIVKNPNWRRGMGSSIHAGIKAIQTEDNHFDAVLILLVDQPAVNVALLNEIIQKSEEGSVLVASFYADSLGVPALFPKAYFEELENLPDNRGAKALLKKYDIKVSKILFPDGAFDIDTPADLERLRTDFCF